MTQDKSALGALPIDIHYNKLLDWLINRRHCTQQYQAYLTVIKDKLQPAKEATEAEDHTDARIRELVVLETGLNFFEIKELFELLKTTDAGKKNIIGQFSSQSMKNWAEIIKLYEKDGTYLAETALKIVRNVNYEVSALKKQISKCQQAQKDYSRKENEHNSSATDLRKQYTASCNRIGIEGKKIKTELASLIKDLPNKLSTTAEEAKSLEEAVKYYKSFSAYILKNESLSQENVKMLTYVIQKGNTSTFEWRTGKKPSRLEPAEINIDLSDEQDKTEESGEIDWGATDVPDTIDFGDFDITVEDGGVLAADNEVPLENPDLDEIDWCVVDSTSPDLQPTMNDEEDVAKGTDALSIMDNPDTRKALVDDLLELRAFLGQRVKEASSDGGDGNIFSSAPSNIHVDEDTLKGMLEKLKSLLDNMTSTQMQHLMLIKDSSRYVDRLRDSLRQKLTLADKMDFNIKEMIRARQEALEEEAALLPQVEVFKKETMTLKKKLEEEISQKYDNRTVRIIGEVNTM